MRRRDCNRLSSRAIVCAALAVFMFALSACGPLPRPFQKPDGVGNPLANNLIREGVEVPPITGTTRPMGEMVSSALAKSLERNYEIPAATSGLDRSRFVLNGHVHKTVPPGASAPVYNIVWRLDEREKGEVETFIEEVPVSELEWDYGSKKVLDWVSENTGARVAKLVLGDRFGSAGGDRLLGKSGVYIAGVQGSPGDGNTSLRRAIAVALGGGGVRLSDTQEDAAFTLLGDVSMGTAEDGVQPITITWTVLDVGGDQLGTAVQSNAVPAGSLDGRWGQTAAFVAAAAQEGIMNIIVPNDPSRLRAPDLGSGPSERSIPATRRLQQVPGRAPPPPG